MSILKALQEAMKKMNIKPAKEGNTQAQDNSVGEVAQTSLTENEKASIQPAQVVSYDEYKEQWLLQLRFRLQIKDVRYVNEVIGDDIEEMLASGVVLIEEGDKYKIVPRTPNETFERIKERILNDREKLTMIKAQSKMLREVQGRTAYSISCENRHEECSWLHNECYLSKCKLAAAKLEVKLQAEYAATTLTGKN